MEDFKKLSLYGDAATKATNKTKYIPYIEETTLDEYGNGRLSIINELLYHVDMKIACMKQVHGKEMDIHKKCSQRGVLNYCFEMKQMLLSKKQKLKTKENG